jgi:hypothetical protein
MTGYFKWQIVFFFRIIIGIQILIHVLFNPTCGINELCVIVQQKKVTDVYYPGLEDHPHHGVAKKQMRGFGVLDA